MEEKNVNVRITTVPNGYVLTFKNAEYMYYTLPALLEGFMYHVGLEELAAIDAETMREFLTASVVWKDNGEAIKALVEARKENEALSNQIKNMKKQIKRLGDKLRDKNSDDDE